MLRGTVWVDLGQVAVPVLVQLSGYSSCHEFVRLKASHNYSISLVLKSEASPCLSACQVGRRS